MLRVGLVKLRDVLHAVELYTIETLPYLGCSGKLLPARFPGFVLNDEVEFLYAIKVRCPLLLPAVRTRYAEERLFVVPSSLSVGFPFTEPGVTSLPCLVCLPQSI